MDKVSLMTNSAIPQSPETGTANKRFHPARRQAAKWGVWAGAFLSLAGGAYAGERLGETWTKSENKSNIEQAQRYERCINVVRDSRVVIKLSDLSAAQQRNCGVDSVTGKFSAGTVVRSDTPNYKVTDAAVALPSVASLQHASASEFRIGNDIDFGDVAPTAFLVGGITLLLFLKGAETFNLRRSLGTEVPTPAAPAS